MKITKVYFIFFFQREFKIEEKKFYMKWQQLRDELFLLHALCLVLVQIVETRYVVLLSPVTLHKIEENQRQKVKVVLQSQHVFDSQNGERYYQKN